MEHFKSRPIWCISFQADRGHPSSCIPDPLRLAGLIQIDGWHRGSSWCKSCRALQWVADAHWTHGSATGLELPIPSANRLAPSAHTLPPLGSAEVFLGFGSLGKAQQVPCQLVGSQPPLPGPGFLPPGRPEEGVGGGQGRPLFVALNGQEKRASIQRASPPQFILGKARRPSGKGAAFCQQCRNFLFLGKSGGWSRKQPPCPCWPAPHFSNSWTGQREGRQQQTKPWLGSLLGETSPN